MSNYCKNCYELTEQLDQLKAELKSAKELREYTYDCCKQAGEELAKNSFEWDGKEKNLVVQAMELNERYDQLKKANDEKNELLAQLGCPTVGTARQLTLSLQQQLEAYKMEADEGNEINAELKAENETLKQYKASKQASYESMQRQWNEAVNENRDLKEKVNELEEELQFAKDGEQEWLKQYKLAHEQRVKTDVENNKYKQALEEIKEVATLSQAHNNKDYLQKVIIEILQKISEAEKEYRPYTKEINKYGE